MAIADPVRFTTTATIGSKCALILPSKVRKAVGLQEGSLIIIEVNESGTLTIRPAKAVPVEQYTDERRAALLLNSAVDAEDYARMRKLVQQMGVDPDRVPHERPD